VDEAEDESYSPPREIPPVLKPFLPVGRTLRDWWRELLVMSLASFVWFGLSLTIIGGPPAGAALYAMARAAALHEQPDRALFTASLRAYFGKSWLLGLVGLLGIILWVVDLSLFLQLAGGEGIIGWVGTVFICYVGLMWLQTLFYAWPMMVCRDDLTLLQLLRNGVVIALRYPIHNFIATIFMGLLFALAVYAPPMVVLVIPALVALLGVHNLLLLAPELVPEDSDALGIVG
jgi:uncharacterized membrane protein YesL